MPGAVRVFVLAALAMTAFAANSVLARMALDTDEIDPGTFTVARLVSGAVILALVVAGRPVQDSRAAPGDDQRGTRRGRAWWVEGSWRSAVLLLSYAATFSYAYVSLGAAAGALVLFAVVQTVIFTAALRSGERPGVTGWSGLALAVAGLLALVAPGARAPDPGGVLLMAVAGLAWAGYTLRGRGVTRPVHATAGNFARSLPLALALSVPLLVLRRDDLHANALGIGLAVLSGAVASGLGYVLWYTVLPWLTRVQSGIVQLAPAPLAAVAGLLVLGEPITARVVVASVLILGGVALGVLRPRVTARPGTAPRTSGLPRQE